MTISNGVKKLLFLLVLSFLVAIPSSSAQVQDISNTQCENLGGECNLMGSMECSTNQTVEGRCTTLGGNWSWGACCKMKDNGPTSDKGAVANLDSGDVPIIGQAKCLASKTKGGWGGRCGSSCNSSGNDAEDLVGLCTFSNTGVDSCCVAKGTALVNPGPDKYLSKAVTEDVCRSKMGGKCEGIDDSYWDPTGGFIDSKDPTCDDTTQVVVSMCQDEEILGSIDNYSGCCVPKDGDYCKKLAAENGTDVCSTMGTGGSVTPLQYGDYQLLEQIPGSPNTSGKLQPYLESLYKAGFVLIVIGAIFMIGFGGFTYMASAGNTSMIKKGKGMITDAIIGLVVALCIWLILNIINPDLVNLKIDPLPQMKFTANDAGGAISTEQYSANEGGGANGSCTAIPESELTTVQGFKMLKGTAENFLAMQAAAKKDGINLVLTSGYRSPQRQEELYKQNCPNGKCRIATAKPCSMGGNGSNHTAGDAIDIDLKPECRNGTSNCNSKKYQWLKANGAQWNFRNNLPTDPVHWSPTGR